MRETAESGGLLDVRVDLAADFLTLNDGGKTEIFQVIISELGRNLCQRLYSHDIHGVADTVPQGGKSPIVFAVPVCHRASVGVVEGRIVHNRGEGQSRAV